METSKAGRALIAQREGNKLKAYRDSGGIWTIGVGHTSAAGPPKVVAGMTINSEESDIILTRDLAKFEAVVRDKVKASITQNEFDALVSLAFNIGGGAFAKSTLLRKLNAGDRAGAADQFLVWNKVKGRAVKGLTTRRQAERRQFLGQSTSKAPRKPAAPAKAKPADEVYASKAMVQIVQARLTDLGYPLGSRDSVTNEFDGKLGTLTATAIRAFRADNALAPGEGIDATLVAALDTAKPRKLAPARENAETKTVAQKAPEVAANWRTEIGAKYGAAGAFVLALIDWVAKQFEAGRETLQPLLDVAGRVPGWAWLLLVVIVLVALWLHARRGREVGVEAFRSGARL